MHGLACAVRTTLFALLRHDDPCARCAAAGEAVRNLRGWSETLFEGPAGAAEIASFGNPMALLGGSDTLALVRGMLERLATLVPDAERSVLAGVGHVDAVSDPDALTEAIARFLLPQGRYQPPRRTEPRAPSPPPARSDRAAACRE